MHHTVCLFLLLVAVASMVEAKGKVKSVKFSSGDDLKGKQKRADLAEEIDALVNEIEGRAVGGRTKANGKGNGLKKKTELQAKVGKHVRLNQEYDGLRVFGMQVVDHVIEEADVELKDKKTGEKTGEVIHVEAQRFLHGEFVDGLKEAVGKLNAKAIGRKSNKMWRKAQENSEKGKKRGRGQKRDGKNGFMEDAEPLIYVDEETQEAQVAFLARIFVEGSDEEDMDYINVLTDEGGNVIKEWSALQLRAPRNKRQRAIGSGPGGNAIIGTYFHRDLLVTNVGGVCKFENSDYRVIDAKNSHDITLADPGHEFPCYTNNDRMVGTAPSVLNDVQKNTQVVFDMYKTWYDMDPFFNKHEGSLPIFVHPPPYDTQWNCVSYSQCYIFFADDKHPHGTALDIVSHEIAHGVTHFSSGLINGDLNYNTQWGGLNEAFSSMAGKAAEYFERGQVNWGYGSDVWETAWYNMDNPDFDHISRLAYIATTHELAGLFNKVFYELSNQFLFGVWDAFDLFYWTNTCFWTEKTDFRTGAELTLKTLDYMRAGIVGTGWSYDYLNPMDVVNVFSTVGIRCRQLSVYNWSCM